jgi:uncharacterized membrane protein YfcA
LFVDPLYAASGLLVGFVVGLTGVGGGSLMTPLLILFFGVHPVTAVGTDLLFAAATKTAGSMIHGFKSAIEWRVVATMALGSVPAAASMVVVIATLGARSVEVSNAVSLVLGAMLLLTSLTIFFRKKLQELMGRGKGLSPTSQAALTVVMGAAIGVLVSISSVGAGAIGVSVLSFLYPRMPTLKIVGSDIAHAVPLTLVAGIGHLAIGSVDWAMLLSLLAGSIPGVLLAGLFAPRVHDAALRWMLGGVLAVVGLRLLLG